MTANKGANALLLVDEFDFSSDTATFTVTCAMSEGESTTLGATAVTSEPILPSMKIEHNGYISGVGDPGTLENELYSRLGVAGSYVAALLGVDVTACPAYVLDGTFDANIKIQAQTKNLMTLDGAWGMGRGGDRGIRIFIGTISATGAQTPADLGSAGSNGGTAYLFVQAKTGSPSGATIKVQSATSSGGTYADEGTFTFSGLGAYKLALSGTVDRWLRLNCTSLGGATNFTVMAIVCLNGVTQ